MGEGKRLESPTLTSYLHSQSDFGIVGRFAFDLGKPEPSYRVADISWPIVTRLTKKVSTCPSVCQPLTLVSNHIKSSNCKTVTHLRLANKPD